MNVLATKTYRIIKLLLDGRGRSQAELEKEVPASHGQVSKVVSWLETHKYVEWANGVYRVLNPGGLLQLFALTRSMDNLKAASHRLALPPDRIVRQLPSSAVLCMETALAAYSDYYRSPRVCVYLQSSEVLPSTVLQSRGNLTELALYKEDLSLVGDTTQWRGKTMTDRVRTLIDLACDGKLYAGKDLLRDLYGLEIE